MIWLLLAVTTFSPAWIYTAALFSPDTTRWANLSGFAALALVFVGDQYLQYEHGHKPRTARAKDVAEAARWMRWVALAALTVARLILPQYVWIVRMNYSGLQELFPLRELVEAEVKRRGHPPASLEGAMGILPELRIWVVDENGEEHIHPATSHVNIVRGRVMPPDDGGWAYDPDSGHVFISCTGLEPKLRRTPLYQH